MKKFIPVFMFVCLFFCFQTSASALTITETDAYGNDTVLLDVDSDDLRVSADLPVLFSRSLNPSPAILAEKIPGLDVDRAFPEFASFVFMDFGPNWQSIVENEQFDIFGRYLYIFYGEYDPEFGNVVAGDDYSGSNKFEWSGLSDVHPDGRSIKFFGPYAFLSYNPDTGAVNMIDNHYPDTITGSAYTLTFEGITADTDADYVDYYPRVITFADDTMSYLSCGSHYIYDDWTNFNWDTSWSGDIDHSGENTDGLLDYIGDGNFESSSNPVVQIFTKALQGLSTIVGFIQQLPTFVDTLVSVLPEPFAEFLSIGFSMIIAVLIVKFALHVLG